MGKAGGAAVAEPASVVTFDRQRLSDALPPTRYQSWSRSLVIAHDAPASSSASPALSQQSSRTESDRWCCTTTRASFGLPRRMRRADQAFPTHFNGYAFSESTARKSHGVHP